jgi:hypothetical protein
MAQMKFLLAKARKNIALILVAEFAVIGWVLFFQSPQFHSDKPASVCSVSCIKFMPKSERANEDRLKTEKTILLNSEFELAAHKLSELMMKIQTKERDLNLLETKYQNHTAAGSKGAGGK